MIEYPDSGIPKLIQSGTSSTRAGHKYTVQIRGLLPADLKRRISTLHAMAILCGSTPEKF